MSTRAAFAACGWLPRAGLRSCRAGPRAGPPGDLPGPCGAFSTRRSALPASLRSGAAPGRAAPAWGRGQFRAVCAASAPLASLRPDLDDVERISRGEAARRRGTGSRGVPHRLNADERQAYDLAKKLGYLTTRGDGHRRARRGSPLANIYRMMCDARGGACVRLEVRAGGTNPAGAAAHEVVVDVSTLRAEPDVEAAALAACQRIARDAGWTIDAECVPSSSSSADVGEDVDADDSPDMDVEARAAAAAGGFVPTWALPLSEARFACAERSLAKAVAQALAEALSKARPSGATRGSSAKAALGGAPAAS